MILKNKDIFKKNSLFKRIFIPMCILILLIVGFIIGIVYSYDILGELDRNSQNLFDQQVANRANDLQTTMISKWTNIENEINEINNITKQLVESHQISIDQLSHHSEDSILLLDKLSDMTIRTLRNHSSTGVYVFLSDGDFSGDEKHFYPGLCFRDNDPESLYGSNNSDLLLARCPKELIDKLNIPTDSSWQPSFEFRKTDLDFYEDTFQNFQLVTTNSDFSLKDVGLWIRPYKLYGSDTYLISYMLPLIYENKIYGAIGIEITFDYLQKMLKYDELSSNSHSAYVLALKEDEQTYQSLFLNGPYYENRFNHFSEIKVKNQNGEYIDDEIYCSSSPLNLYNSNTPYASQQWFLLGLEDKTDLFQLTYYLKDMLMFVFVIVIGIGVVLSFMITRYISKPIVDLADRISQSAQVNTRLALKKTNIIEVDQLIQAIEKMSNDVLDSASRFSNIIRLANTKLAGFEIDYQTNHLFITDGFFEIFMLHDIDTKNMTVDEFNRIFKAFDGSCRPTQNRYEFIYHIETAQDQIYLRLRYHETDEKCVGLIEEISDIIKERQAIEHERDHDVLTGLINRRAFQRQMKKLFTIYTHELNIAALVMIDLDNLKTINDKYGHDCGDAYIKAAGQVFDDYSPKGTIVSRTSGDEFYLFYYGYQDKEDINKQLDHLKEGIANTLVTLPNQEQVKIYVSGGVAWYPSDSTDFDELQRYSDYAMYSVKRTSKGEIRAFNISDYENNTYISKKRADFQQLIQEKMIYYVYQPVIDVRSSQIFGYEALMRSYHPNLKEAREIISLAKLEAQLNKIEYITWFQSLETYNEYYQKGLVSKQQSLFINSISSQVLDDEKISLLTNQYHHLLDKVILEVTEDEENDEECFKRKKAILSSWNAKIALDDYGSGYNSEINLLSVNPNYVKIDMNIIRDIDSDPDKQKIVENIISYCHERQKKVIAEGVETLQELKLVLYLDVDYVQGYIFAKPGDIPSTLNQDALKVLLEFKK